MSHPGVENLDRMVLLLSNQRDHQPERQFLEVPNGVSETGTPANVRVKKLDIGWFDQAWYAEGSAESSDKASTAYTLRNIRSGTYLKLGERQTDGSTSLLLGPLAPRNAPRKVQNAQIWEITNDSGFARITSLANKQAFELVESLNGSPVRIKKCVFVIMCSARRIPQTWRYERVSRSAEDVKVALQKSDRPRNLLIEYQSTDATYIVLPPHVRHDIWESTGLGKGSLTWKSQAFDCDDFAFTAKAAVACWAAKNLKGDGFAILFGITFGDRETNGKLERHAYNWYLDWDTLTKVKFFEPSYGIESDKGWDYRGFGGIF